jgi:prophage endopeptidase
VTGFVARPAAILFSGLAIFVAGFFCAWQWQASRYAAVIARRELSYQADIAAIGNAAAAQARTALLKQQENERARDRIDQQATSKRDQLNAENDALRRSVADGTRRLRIAGRCRASGSDMSHTSSAASVGDAGTVELDSTAGQRVLDLRSSIIADQAALNALQRYVREVCLASQASPSAP